MSAVLGQKTQESPHSRGAAQRERGEIAVRYGCEKTNVIASSRHMDLLRSLQRPFDLQRRPQSRAVAARVHMNAVPCYFAAASFDQAVRLCRPLGQNVKAMRDEPLSRHPALRTRDVGELRQRLSGLFSVWSMELGRGTQGSFEGRLNHRQLQHVGLTYAQYGSPLAVSLSQAGLFLHGFPLRGGGDYIVDGSAGLVSRDRGIVGGPGADMRLRYSSDFEHLILRIEPERLTRTLSRLIGRPVDPPLRMMTNAGRAPEMAEAQHRLLEFVVQELDRDNAALPGLVLAELEEALIVSYLTCNRHNYSHFLEGPVPPAAPWQVRRVEDYVEQNWDQPLTVEALAFVANASVRSLFYSFKRSRDVSPMAFVRQVRLRHAHQMLRNRGPDTSVTSVAYACGFSNLGHFARYYCAAFGEPPSKTLKSALLGSRGRRHAD